jgi:hypothetical protein
MKLRLSLALIACLVGASLIPATAAANPPEKEEFSPAGDQIACDGTLLTVSSGLIVGRIHEHELPSGRIRAIGVFLNRNVRATDVESGTVYRVVGGVRHNFTFPPDEQEGEEIGFFHEKMNIIGPGGLFGKVNFRQSRKKKDEPGVFTERDKGNCRFVEDDEE